MSQNYGASPTHWLHFNLILGLYEDLLPVVSNPNAVISPKSKMKDLGKTPSRYNSKREVGGIAEWTQYKATIADLARWEKEPDYGICLQTRYIRAFDLDIADKDKLQRIVEFIGAELHWLGLPCRSRENSSKCLLAFAMRGEFAKRVLKVDGGMIEFLANGQQFIAVGTHPSGARYEWQDGLPMEFPELSPEQFEKLWMALVKEFGIETPTTGNLRRPKNEKDIDIFDPTLDKLDILSWGKEGQAFITCPFAHEHTTPDSETGTVYFPKGTRGYAQGHFKCLHAHCASRSDGEFLDALGIRDADFEIIETLPGEPEPWPKFARNKLDQILPTKNNTLMALSRSDICGWQIRYDAFNDCIMVAPYNTTRQWRTFMDTDYFDIAIGLERQGFKPVSKEIFRDAMNSVAKRNRFDTAIEWLTGLEWDGVPRVQNFFRDYFGAADDDYTQSVSLYLWTALAGRILEPGIKADMVPVLIGKQGVGKSFGVSELVPSYEFFESINLMERDADLARRMRGKMVIEIGELRGLHSRDMESIKEFITRTYESWVPKYQEFAQKYPRRSVFLGTTNQEEFLADTTGNRRWLPVRCPVVNVAAIKADRLQLWAEAREIFGIVGVMWNKAQTLAEGKHEEHRMTDTWAEEIGEWLTTADGVDEIRPIDRKFIQVNDVLKNALRFEMRNVSRGEEMRVASILREFGFTRKKLQVDGKQTKVWVLGNA